MPLTAQRDWSLSCPNRMRRDDCSFKSRAGLRPPAPGYQVTESGRPWVDAYLHRTEQTKHAARQGVHEALAQMMTSEA